MQASTAGALVHQGHGRIIDEDRHLLATRWAEGLACLPLNLALDASEQLKKHQKTTRIDTKSLFWNPNGCVALLKFKRFDSIASSQKTSKDT